ncbi:uncharacterized protein LOC111285612 [Durio zibethinus]|uniref:Uncharacterized protein LOC111285612 n=1 Tax=Durio zibethinus TaxID=66656 RepID=A0A6P5XRP7_DURZI|nr:uncharacterized protein LOC111285612 [Durio zibethinus]
MKLLSSSPSISYSSSSSSTVSFDLKMCTSKSATGGCLAGILRRILCFRSLPTHPSDHVTEADSVASHKKQRVNAVDKLDDASKVTPGIVARLMGLDSLPEISLLKTQANPNSITRSRSMNSADYKQDTDTIHGKHRRVNSTLSFRDMPTYFELENDEFFVLSFEKGSEAKEMRSKRRKCKGSSGELKQRKEEKENSVETVPEKQNKDAHEQASKRVLNVLNVETVNRRIVDKPNWEVAKCSELNYFSLERPIVSIKGLDCSKRVDKKGVPDGAKLSKKKKKIQHRIAQNVEPECSSEDSSPVSVLDFDQFIIDHDVPTSEEDSKAERSNTRRKLSPDMENYGCQPPSNDSNVIEDDPGVNIFEGKDLKPRKKDCHSEKNLECWDAVCGMIEAEVAKSSWLCSKNEDLEDVTADFGSKILDQLLDELVVQLKNLNS